MIFGKIEYLNLLPFHIFMKRYLRSSGAKMSMEYKRGVPTAINNAFSKRRVDAAFISSISAQRSSWVPLGIVAKKSVKSVLIVPNKADKKDAASASSNMLAKVLGLEGEVLIGDKALRYALSCDDYIDLAEMWHKHTALPFVFALLCYHNEQTFYEDMAREFLKRSIRIPRYILNNASKRSGVAPEDIIEYLKLISYRIDGSAMRGLKRFYKEAKKVH